MKTVEYFLQVQGHKYLQTRWMMQQLTISQSENSITITKNEKSCLLFFLEKYSFSEINKEFEMSKKTKLNSGAFFNKEDDMDEEWFFLLKGKQLYDIIYKKAVFLHETHQKCDKNIRKSTIDEIQKEFPELEKEYPKIYTEVCYHFDFLCQNQKAMSPVIYNQILQRLKKEHIL